MRAAAVGLCDGQGHVIAEAVGIVDEHGHLLPVTAWDRREGLGVGVDAAGFDVDGAGVVGVGRIRPSAVRGRPGSFSGRRFRGRRVSTSRF